MTLSRTPFDVGVMRRPLRPTACPVEWTCWRKDCPLRDAACPSVQPCPDHVPFLFFGTAFNPVPCPPPIRGDRGQGTGIKESFKRVEPRRLNELMLF